MGILTYIIIAIPFLVWLIKCIIFRLNKKETNWWEYRKSPDFVNECVENTIVVAFLWSVMMFVMAGISIFNEKEYKITKSANYDIISASQNDRIEGDFFLFGGYIESRPVYKVYRKNEDGSIIMAWMYAENTKIIETDDVSPHITEFLEGDKVVKKWSKWHDLTIGNKGSKTYKRLIHSKNLQHNGIIYVPKGTIIPAFEGINLK